MSMNSAPVYVKQPHARSYFNSARAKELIKCAQNIQYFCEKYVMIQHPLKGNVPFVLFNFQREMLDIFTNYKYVTCLTARQMGKSITSHTIITYDDKKVKLFSLIPMNFKEKIVTYLENLLLNLSK